MLSVEPWLSFLSLLGDVIELIDFIEEMSYAVCILHFIPCAFSLFSSSLSFSLVI